MKKYLIVGDETKQDEIPNATYRDNSFNKAVLKPPNGDIVQGVVKEWKKNGYNDQIQVVIDGKTYLVHSSNIVLIAE